MVALAFIGVISSDAKSQIAPKVLDDTSQAITFECTDASIRHVDDANLTKEEKIERMDQALFESLSRYDACQNQRNGIAAGSGGESGGEASGNGRSSHSVASSDMTGEEKKESETILNSEFANPNNADSLETDGSGSATSTVNSSNGKAPEDIPSVDNDSVLAAQIRYAAINEKDPKTKKKLWNEYRKYKGLPQNK